jgi:hypothetical protein
MARRNFAGCLMLETGRSEAEIPRTREYWIKDIRKYILFNPWTISVVVIERG